MRSFSSLLAMAVIALAITCPAQTTSPSTTRATATPTTRPVGVAAETLTLAEQIIRIRRTVDADKEQIAEIERKLGDPDSEYTVAEKEFGRLDSQLSELKKRKQQLEEANKPLEAQTTEVEIQVLTTKWDTARARFGLAVEERKTFQEKLLSLGKKLNQDTRALGALEAGSDKPAIPADPAVPKPTQSGGPATTSQATTSRPAEVKPAAPTSQPAIVMPATLVKPKDQALVKAVHEAEVKKAEAQEAGARLQTIEETRATLVQNIETERKLLEIARGKQQQAKEEQKQLRVELDRAAREAPERTSELWSKIYDARQRESRAAQDARNSEERIGELDQEHVNIEAQKSQTAQEVSAIKSEVEQAEKKVKQLQNPFTFHNMAQWLIDHGPKLLMIVVGVATLYVLVRLTSRRVADLVARNSSRGSLDDRQNRASTLVGVFSQTASLVVIGGGAVMFLEEIGVPVVPLLGGAAVLGLAVAFGAQNLIRDYFAGFMVLVEDQYSVGDVVRIGTTAGLVERITLRMTMLRDLDGVAHFIPHGSMTSVSNMTHSWSRASFDIPVAYKENVDRVIGVLTELASELRADPEYSEFILCPMEMLGVDAFADSAIIIKFVIKTRALKQWAVKRELLRRIKNRFDALGIEIPFPHMTVYHRQTA